MTEFVDFLYWSFFCAWTGICFRLGQATADALLNKKSRHLEE